MKIQSIREGLSGVPVLLIILIVVLISLIGWRVLSVESSSSTQSHPQSTQKSVAQQVETAPVGSKADVERAQSTLDSSTVETDLDSSELDQDLNDLL